MYKIVYTNRMKRDAKLMQKREDIRRHIDIVRYCDGQPCGLVGKIGRV